MKTLQQILIDINSYLDLTAELPTGDDLTVRTNFAQQAVEEWGSAYNWRQLNVLTHVFVTTATLSLSSNFRSLLAPPQAQRQEYPEISMSEVLARPSSDKYVYITGSRSSGYTMTINGLPAAGATLSIPFQRYPSNMATLTDVCELPDSDFIKHRVISYVLQSRLDERFPVVDGEAKRTLQNMIGREQIVRPGGSGTLPRFGAAAYRIGAR